MAVDTRFKRFAMMSFGTAVVPLGLGAGIMFEADGAVDADDRAHLLNLYGGIALFGAVATPPDMLPLLGVG